MQILLILLPIIALLIWVIKSRRYSDGLFLISVAACIFTFVSGFDLLSPYKDTEWQGVVLISVSLVSMLAAAIALKVLARRDNLHAIGATKSSKLEEQQDGTSNGG
jgi:hypothetical protein